MSTQETIHEVIYAITMVAMGAGLMFLYKFRIAIKSPEKVLVEKVCVTANGQEYCRSFIE